MKIEGNGTSVKKDENRRKTEHLEVKMKTEGNRNTWKEK